MIIDIHTHLTDARYIDKEAVVKDFVDNNGAFMLDCGYDDDTSIQTLQNAKQFSNVYSVVGIHPEKAYQVNDCQLQKLTELSENEKVVAIGEIGLDYHYEGFDKKLQLKAFESQIILADKLKMPFVVHSRDSSKDVYDCLYANRNYINKGFLMHCYSESSEQAKKYLNLGAYFSFGGVITFKNSKKEDIIKTIPLDRIFCETDAPYLTPTPHRGKMNYPAFVRFVYDKMKDVYEIERDELEQIILDNATRLFKKVKL